MPQKVIIDADPGLGDALALVLALRDPELDVIAVTGVGGCVSAAQAAQNIWAIIEAVDPPKRPRIGVADSPDAQYELVRFSERYGDAALTTRRLNGENGLGDWPLGDVQRHHSRSAVKLLHEVTREFPGEVSLITLGPLTNLAWAIEWDPEFLARVKGLYLLGGAVAAPGDLTPVGEFNVCFHPDAARRVLRAAATKTLIPLDVGRKAALTFDHLRRCEWDETRSADRLVQSLLNSALRGARQHLGQEAFWVYEAAAIAAVSRPELFQRHAVAVDVETDGTLTRGMTVVDRRPRPAWRPNIDLLTDVDAQGLLDYALRLLQPRPL